MPLGVVFVVVDAIVAVFSGWPIEDFFLYLDAFVVDADDADDVDECMMRFSEKERLFMFALNSMGEDVFVAFRC